MKTLEVFTKLRTQKDCVKHLERIRWNGDPFCPYCNAKKPTAAKEGNRYHCNKCNTSFSVTVGTIFQDTRLPLKKWFLALNLILNARKKISARQLARDLKVNKKTGWYMGMKIYKSMAQVDERALLLSVVEIDQKSLQAGGYYEKQKGS